MRGWGWFLFIILVGCDKSVQTDRPAPVDVRLATVESVESAVPASPRPGPNRGRLVHAVGANDACVACHPTEAQEWLGSHHQRSNTNEAYRRSFEIEPLAFCQGCHAPESNPMEPPPEEVSDLGVGCVTCHVVEEGKVLAAPLDDKMPTERGEGSPHAIVRTADFAMTGACKSCHEFTFPGRSPSATADAHWMQTTLREHQRSPAASTPCADCHMPLVNGRRSHGFSQVRDPEWLRQQLKVHATATEFGTVVVTLTQSSPGHAFPTGDLFRRLQVGARVGSSDKRVAIRYLSRHFEMRPGVHTRALAADDRVFDKPREVELDLPCKPGEPIHYWVTYQRVAQVFDGRDEAGATVESEVEIDAGVVRCAQTQ